MVEIIKGQPLVLPNGDTVLPGSMSEKPTDDPRKGDVNRVKSPLEQKIEAEIQKLLDDPFKEVRYERTLADITEEFRPFSSTMLIVALSMWGLQPVLIGRVLGVETEVVKDILSTELFARLRKELVEAVRYSETGTIHGYLQSQAARAAVTVAAHMEAGDGDRSLAASKDILDRAGFRAVDRVDHVVRFEDELRIVHIADKPIKSIDIMKDDL